MSGARTDTGVLLALAGDDSAHVRAIDAAGTGLVVVRRCGDVAELLSAAMAGLAGLAVVSTVFDDVDLTVLERLTRAGTRGVLLVDGEEAGRWSFPGWKVLDAGAEPAQVRSLLQALGRQAAPATTAAVPGRPEPGQSLPSGPDLGDRAAGAAPWSARAGAHHQPAPAPAPTPEDLAAVQETDPGRLLVVWGPHGAPGRSMVAAALATGLSRVGPTILVDADTEAPSLAQALSLPDGSSALATAARLASRSRLDAEAFAGLLVPAGGQVEVLPGLGRSGRWRELPPAAMSRVWELCRERATWTVVDISGGTAEDEVDPYTLEAGHGALRAALLREADVVVVVGGADPVGVRRLLQLLADAAEETAVTGRLEVVVNRVRASAAGPSPERAVREALSRFGALEEATLLPQDEAADACLLAGTSVLEGAPASALGRALAVLVDRVDPKAGARALAASARRAGWWRRRSAPVATATVATDPVATAAEPGRSSRRATAPGARVRRRSGGRHRG
ncbi:AAA family ATPase [Actinomyces sp. W5033]|uniref:AAA family ATPase n=1 Tax=Actinomyces sp. W5033 TaxID=3446479 RepID=UPI003EDF9B58